MTFLKVLLDIYNAKLVLWYADYIYWQKKREKKTLIEYYARISFTLELHLKWKKSFLTVWDIFAATGFKLRLLCEQSLHKVFYKRAENGQRYQMHVSRLFAIAKEKYYGGAGSPASPLKCQRLGIRGNPNVRARVSARGMEMSGFINSCIYIWPG